MLVSLPPYFLDYGTDLVKHEMVVMLAKELLAVEYQMICRASQPQLAPVVAEQDLVAEYEWALESKSVDLGFSL